MMIEGKEYFEAESIGAQWGYVELRVRDYEAPPFFPVPRINPYALKRVNPPEPEYIKDEV